MLLCGSCGVEVEANQRYCLDCGQLVTRGEATSATSQIRTDPQGQSNSNHNDVTRDRSKTTWLIPVVACLFTVGLSVGITVWLLRNHNESTTISNSQPVQITASASSTRNAYGGLTYLPNNCIDGNLATAWVEGVAGSGIGEWIRFDFEHDVELLRLRLAPGYFKSSQSWVRNNRLAVATIFLSDGSSRVWYLDDRMEQQALSLGGVKTRWVRMTIDKIYPGSADSEDSPISEITFDLKR